jgi:hypothetical protein
VLDLGGVVDRVDEVAKFDRVANVLDAHPELLDDPTTQASNELAAFASAHAQEQDLEWDCATQSAPEV